jgi:hypothetical protein
MPDDFPVTGRIAQRWHSQRAADGPFGRALGPEEEVPGRNGRRQRFEHGEIAFSADQDMVVSVFRLRNEACFEWEPTGFRYNYFRYDVIWNGIHQGQQARQLRGTTLIWTRLQGFGEYAFIVKGCHEFLGGDECNEGLTIPVRVQLGLYTGTPDPSEFPVNGLIAERWHELGAWDGPLGVPTGPEQRVPIVNLRGQRFERGWIATQPRFGPNTVVAVYQRGVSLEINWGGFNEAFHEFRVNLKLNGQQFFSDNSTLDLVSTANSNEWARQTIGSGQFILRNAPAGFYQVRIVPLIGIPVPLGATEDLGFDVKWPGNVPIDMPALNGSPEHGYASHTTRATDIARHYAMTRPLRIPFNSIIATEDDTIELMAHLHMLTLDPDFHGLGELPSRILTFVRLRQFMRGETGTSFNTPVTSRKGDYDMALKGLLAIAYRYRQLLTSADVDFILDHLMPGHLNGPHDVNVEFYEVSFLQLDFPETENHLLMIETCRYLGNQLQLVRTGNAHFDNKTNGLRDWLLGHLQRLAKHDFLEFNSRPYARLSVHAILNLHEFAHDDEVRTAAQIVLDYVTVKFAVSSNRWRRVGPFRRLRDRTNSAEANNELLMDSDGDPMTGFFMTYTGLANRDGIPDNWFPDSWSFNAIIAGLAAYRPPPAAYILAMTRQPPMQHRFYHGKRPRLRASPDIADGGVEIYYKSPSFLLTAGGMFLNSGYGSDDLPINDFAQCAIPQSLTLVPTRSDLKFVDLIRFDPYPDWRDGVTTGVDRGFACGSNLRIPDRWFERTGISREGPWFFLDLDRDVPPEGRLGLYVAAYHTPPERPEDLVKPLDNLGVLHAVEAADVGFDFERFKRLTLERNTELPQKFEFGGTYTFRTADNHTIVFRLWPNGLKYLARIVGVDGVVPNDLFQALHLAEGDFLSAPGGHDGKIEVLHPGCKTPLVLDYRDPLRPVRNDNAEACPAPWSARSQAIIAVAGQFLTRSVRLSADGKPLEAASAARQAVSVLRGHSPTPDAAANHWWHLGVSLQTVAVKLMEAHRVDQSLQPAAEAVAAYRHGATIPGANHHAIAGQLLNLSVQLTANGRPIESIESPRAAVDVLRGPAAAPDATADVTSLFAMSLITLATRLFEARRIDEAVAPALEAVTACRRAATSAGADQHALAGPLINLSNQLTANARPVEAIEPPRAAADILRGPAAAPGATADITFLFAFSLRLVATRLMEAGRADEAPAPATEAVAAFRHAAKSANANHHAMAGELLNLSRQLTANARPVEAIEPPRAAADILRRPAAAPDASADITWSFAYSLMTVATRLMEARRADEAPAPAAEAITAFRHAATSPGANHQAIAGELLNLSRQLTAAARPVEAIAPPRAAADILRGPAGSPDSTADITFLFAYSLMTVATRLMEARRAAEAPAPAAEAVTAFRHAATRAGANHHAIAGELLNLSRQLTASARPVEAIEPPRAAADILRGPAGAPDATADITFLFGYSLMTVATRLMEAGRAAEAPAPAAEAVTAFRRAATVTGSNHRAIAGELLNLSRQLTANARHVDALDSAGAAVDVFRAVASLPDAQVDDRSLFAVLLHTLALRLIDADRRNDALPPAEESIVFYRRLAQEDPATFAGQLAEVERLAASLRPA